MLAPGTDAPSFTLPLLDGGELRHSPGATGKPSLVVFFETDCPTCRLTLPYLDRLARALGSAGTSILGVSQDDEASTRALVERIPVRFPIALDPEWSATRLYDPLAVPSLFLLAGDGRVLRADAGFDKAALNGIAAILGEAFGTTRLEVASPFDGAPDRKPGCVSRHLEPGATPGPERGASSTRGPAAPSRNERASRVELGADTDPHEYSMESFGDPLPVVPPTVERVERMLASVDADPSELIALIPPNYGEATLEKVAANAVMAGCRPELLPVLVAAVQAACDERFNLHGVQATTHFAAPLLIVNGPARARFGFASGSNVFSNVSRANSTLGRALSLILSNLGGARPGEIDMSTLGNPGKFSYCIAENEEESPWEPLHVELGFAAATSTVTLFAAEPPRGVSEHNARTGREVLRTIGRTLSTVWSPRMCGMEAIVVLCPEHVRTLRRDGFSKAAVREFLFDHTGIPAAAFRPGDTGEGVALRDTYVEIAIEGERCYRKFREPEAIKLLVAGGTAGKFSAVIGSWATGPRGSQMVTYPITRKLEARS